MDELERMQRWFQAVITHPGGVEDGVASYTAKGLCDVSADDMESVIARSRALSAAERMNIYASAYYARLLECLRGEFPVLARALGDELFDEFSFGYLQTYPSRSYTLGRLGAEFAHYLQETRPGDRESGAPGFLVDLARLEWAINEAFDAPGAEQEGGLQVEDLSAIPPARWSAARLIPANCLRLLPLEYAVNDYYTRVRQDTSASPPACAPTWMAVSRRDYVVRRHELSRAQFDLLIAVCDGATIGQAILRAVQTCGADAEELAAGIGRWFQHWAAERFFCGVEVAC